MKLFPLRYASVSRQRNRRNGHPRQDSPNTFKLARELHLSTQNENKRKHHQQSLQVRLPSTA